ncbi:MFS transporter [Nocardia sp. XZ_19_369]|uniref:MFS transporter n=1 Tax=Nocardia sp. XZ_19_369 TaxID=2769487 RepID=UPI0035A2FBE0
MSRAWGTHRPTSGGRRQHGTAGVVAAAALALAATAPGQTAAVSVFVDPIIADLGVSRSAVSTAYLIGSLAGAVAMPFVGRVIDRYGPRAVMVAVAASFGAMLLAATLATEIIGLTAAFVGIRVGGQGALTLVATTAVAVYVHQRRGLAVGAASALGTAGISLAPVLLERLVSDWGWRQVWIAEGIAVWILVIPAALMLLPRWRAGTARVEGAAGRQVEVEPSTADRTLGQAARTGLFWVITGGVSVCAMVTTGLMFHQQSLLGERGLTTTQAAAIFLPQTVAGLIATFGLGWLADRVSDRLLVAVTMGVLAAATAGAGWVAPGPSAVLYGLAIGAAGNGIRTLEAVAFSRSFGVRHLGTIRGVVHSVSVGASAFGPLLLAVGREHASSYRPILLAFTALPVAVAIAAALVREPPPVAAVPPAPDSPEMPTGELAAQAGPGTPE